ncbi:MAG: hypothetical protein IME92_06260 [Proteobacteria bacterium]|nr:hypothetical protein [Pseudomonadota bacterium]
MILTELTSVLTAALPITQFKAHLRLGTGFADSDLQDELLEAYLRAAISTIEARAGRVLLQKQYSWQLTHWRDVLRQVLPVRPVSGVTAVKLIDVAGVEVLADTADFRFVPDDICPAIEATNTVLPKLSAGGAVEVVFDAGFGPDWADVPSDLGQAVLLVAANAYENRSGTGEAVPMAALSLIEPYRVLRLKRGA